jgi:RNA recognition motif-containing protein
MKRLYIGNLHPSISEYSLIKLFEKFGDIQTLDFLWHSTGPKKGEPRGYCFLEYQREEVGCSAFHDKSAQKAIDAMNGKILLGRAMIVRNAIEKVKDKSLTPDTPSKSLDERVKALEKRLQQARKRPY